MAGGNALCEALAYANLTFAGLCGGPPVSEMILPTTDKSVFEHTKPVAAPKPKPKPGVEFPAVLVTETVERLVEKEVDPEEVERLAEARAAKLLAEWLREQEQKAELERKRLAAIAAHKARLAREAREALGPDAAAAIRRALEYNAALRRAQTTALEDWTIEQPSGQRSGGFGGFDIGPEAGSAAGAQVAELGDGFARYKTALGLQDRAYEWDGTEGGPPIDNSYILTTDRFIKATTQNSINSQIGEGEVVLTVKEDVYGYHSREPLLPKGTALVCDYQGPEVIGESRIQFNCKRALLAETRREILISSPVGDMQGAAGLSGEVDNRNWEKYGSAILLTAMSASIQYLGTKVVTSSGGTESAEGQAVNAATADLGEKFGEITAAIIEQTIDLKPIVRIASGTVVHIKPLQDWYVRPVERATAG